ncbi:hypothetical protein C4D60_Mb05t05130 [Musa balbisiana]|uniref:Uncharacterized protein n=1 Tax=Musa balbisiana TaxID=52838 RepID=A0A4S8JTU5_MUSBA|nr:hypothetical protein C4D60_Mb05t05130 [Musa balbisiana]
MVREVSERAIASVPPAAEKQIKLREELDAQDIARTRKAYRINLPRKLSSCYHQGLESAGRDGDAKRLAGRRFSGWLKDMRN